ncbi:hypothetical protein R1flu_028410 [Riccia fluitans]|uniref:Uncharacterized protein n=1 Tax=Riccia fluitans TaxID=41844 RepID=A0ABD1XLN7_9MARC
MLSVLGPSTTPGLGARAGWAATESHAASITAIAATKTSAAAVIPFAMVADGIEVPRNAKENQKNVL